LGWGATLGGQPIRKGEEVLSLSWPSWFRQKSEPKEKTFHLTLQSIPAISALYPRNILARERGITKNSLKIQTGMTDSNGMAQIQPSVIASGMKGKAGSVVMVQMSDGRTIIRPRTIPRNPRTPKQQASRALMKRATEAYRNLAPEQLQAWQVYTDKLQAWQQGQGVNKTLRVCDIFISLSVKYLQIHPGESVPVYPPDDLFSGDAVQVTAQGEAGRVRFKTDIPNQPGVLTELLLAPTSSPIAQPNLHAFRHMTFIAFQSGSLETTVPAGEGWHAAAIRFVRSNTGQTTPLLRVGMVRVMPNGS